jgi:biopolymer transport protein ExbD
MSTWRVRHEGSPRSIDNLSLQQVLEGLADGHWEATDEVMGPNDREWVALENHPQFAEIAADLEPRPAKEYDDETRLDMNALIDVTLVLLIFFIITTSYAILQKRLDAPNITSDEVGLPVVTKDKLAEQFLYVEIRMENGSPVIKLERQPVSAERLEYELIKAQERVHRTSLILEHDDDVPHRCVVDVLNAARGAKLEAVRLAVPKKKK